MSGFLFHFVFVRHVEVVEVPVELGFPLFLQPVAQEQFYFLHHVEAHEDVGLIFEIEFLLLDNLPIKHAFVGYILLCQTLLEVLIDGFQVAP